MWLTCFNIWWRWLSRLISFYLLSLNLVAAASDYPAPATTYACEDTSDYYSPVRHLRGEALKKKLNSIIAPHHSLSYQEVILRFKCSHCLVLLSSVWYFKSIDLKCLSNLQVWDALKVLDAADIDHPEASAGMYGLMVVIIALHFPFCNVFCLSY